MLLLLFLAVLSLPLQNTFKKTKLQNALHILPQLPGKIDVVLDKRQAQYVNFKNLGRIQIGKVLGKGDFGTTFLSTTNPDVVIKVPKYTPSNEIKLKTTRLQGTSSKTEIEALKRMGLYLDDVILDDQRVVIAMKRAKGITLDYILKR